MAIALPMSVMVTILSKGPVGGRVLSGVGVGELNLSVDPRLSPDVVGVTGTVVIDRRTNGVMVVGEDEGPAVIVVYGLVGVAAGHVVPIPITSGPSPQEFLATTEQEYRVPGAAGNANDVEG